MKSKFKITIPEPCHENWDKMTPDATGKFCQVCNKSVIDFTNKLPDEIQHFFNTNKNQKICGRLNTSQLDSVSIKIPSQVLFSQTQYHKMFLLALFIAMGSTLFSCANLNGDKQKIEKVELTKADFDFLNLQIIGMVIPSQNLKNNTEVQKIKPPKTCEDSLAIFKKYSDHSKFPVKINYRDDFYTIFPLRKYKNKRMWFMSESLNRSCSQDVFVKDYSEKEIINKQFSREIKPHFPGGMKQFFIFFANEFKIPKNIKMDDVIDISMIIEPNGSLTYIESEENIDETVKNEIIRILKLSPKWIPGRLNCTNIQTDYTFNILFIDN
ncbi:hypothetical protein [Flavobacterium chungangensis]|uniref:TonB C-terminal domain-containing protein n=1 Tax=Flavobacterium chungangensis TaxID=2708132 RepID=A0ABV8Z930_9FLAO